MAQLIADRVDSGYRRRPVLAGVSLSVKSGEMLALIGPNGAGKTTLLRVLARQLAPTAGMVTLDDVPLWQRSPGWAARHIAVALPGRSTSRPLTVREAVALGRAPHSGWLLPLSSKDDAAIEHALERAGLSGLRDRLITELSAGEAQRVLLARALAQQPAVLLVDEPTSHLDLRYQGEILDCLWRLSRDGMAVVLAIHDLNLAALWADRIALITQGKLLAIGTPGDVLTAERLEAAYQTPLHVSRHPSLDTLMITPVPRRRQLTP